MNIKVYVHCVPPCCNIILHFLFTKKLQSWSWTYLPMFTKIISTKINWWCFQLLAFLINKNSIALTECKFLFNLFSRCVRIRWSSEDYTVHAKQKRSEWFPLSTTYFIFYFMWTWPDYFLWQLSNWHFVHNVSVATHKSQFATQC